MKSRANSTSASHGFSSPRLVHSPVARGGVAAGVFFLAFAAFLRWGRLDPEATETITDLTFVALGLIYVPLAVRTARSAYGRVKAAWVAMAIGFAFWLLGESLWAYYQLIVDEVPSPAWSDAAYLAYYPWVCLALLLFPTARSWRSQARVILDAIIVTGSFFLISWLTLMRSVWQARSESKLEFVVSLAYPVGDLLIATIGVLVLIRAAPGLRRTLTLLVAGLLAAALADSWWVYQSNAMDYSAGSWIDLLYAANALLIIVALIAGYKTGPGHPRIGATPGWMSRSLPLLPLAVAAVFVAVAHPDVVTESPVVITGLVLIVSLVLRQILEAAELGTRERQIRAMADRLSGELASASRYVASVLPGDLDGPVRIRSRYLPALEIGGDSFGYMWIDDDHLIVYLIDVSGHGVEPALLSISVHNMLWSRSMSPSTLCSPADVMAELNQLFGMDGHDDHYFTMWYGVYQASTGLLRYVTAGHPPALAFTGRHGATEVTLLGGSAIPVGMFADSTFTADTYRVTPGAQILICSDGVLGERLSFEEFAGLCEDVAAAPGWSPSSLIARLRATAGGKFEDDCALVQVTFGKVSHPPRGLTSSSIPDPGEVALVGPVAH